MLKHKRIFLIIFAVLFIVVLFVSKNKITFKNESNFNQNGQQGGLTYDNIPIEDSVNKDTDGDSIFDWVENLYGLDPTKRETTPGTPDKISINKLRSNGGDSGGNTDVVNPNTENLTETDKFSRELFATIAAATQNGVVDQATIEGLGASLADHIQNSLPRKVFSIFEIKIIDSDTVQDFKNYNVALNNIYKKYPGPNYTILDVLQKFMIDENNVDTSALLKLDPIIIQTNKIIEEMLKISVPQSISTLHLNVINSQERLVENLSDIKLYENDPIIMLGGISKYQENATKLETGLNNLADAINQKLSQ